MKNRSLSAVTAGVNHSSLTAPQVSYQPELQRKISVTSIYLHNYSQSLLFSRRKKEVMLYTSSLHPFQSPSLSLSTLVNSSLLHVITRICFSCNQCTVMLPKHRFPNSMELSQLVLQKKKCVKNDIHAHQSILIQHFSSYIPFCIYT